MLGMAKGSNQYYMERLQALYAQKYGTEKKCPIEVVQTDFSQINAHLPNQFEYLNPLISEYTSIAEGRGIAKLMIPNFTIHESIDQINPDIEIAHPLQLCTEYLLREKVKSVIVFGSLYTMSAKYLSTALESVGVKIKTTSKVDAEKIDQFRRDVYNTIETPQTVSYTHLTLPTKRIV